MQKKLYLCSVKRLLKTRTRNRTGNTKQIMTTMNKKYTVFVSSTYEDLQNERKKVIESLLSLNCFPIGMEYFNASDDSQWEVIKNLIDESDYYILIIAGRYGSIDEASGMSYTQKEYEYAKDQGIPILSFIRSDIDSLPAKYVETNSDNKARHEQFVADAKTRLCKYWNSADDLASNVILGLVSAMKSKPRIGWIRADIQTSAEANKEILRLRKENDALRAEMNKIQESAPQGTETLAQGEDLYCVHFDYYNNDDGIDYEDGQDTFSWNQIFAWLAPYMVVECVEYQLENHFTTFVEENVDKEELGNLDVTNVYKKHFQDVKVQFLALGLIAKSTIKKSASNTQVYWTLTPYGHKVMMQLKAIKKEK